MSKMTKAFNNALLADATYALNSNNLNGLTGSNLVNLLGFEDRMTPTLAKYIGDNFTVVTHIETGDFLQSGFDATVWKDNATGKLTVTMQGTSGLQDFLSDADLAVTANARSQIVDMVNWWFKITTPAGQSARQIRLAMQYDNSAPPLALGTRYAIAPDVPGTGLVLTAQLLQGVGVSGHSLGGYLATAFTRLFGSQAHISHTSTFNSAGFAPGSETVFRELQNIIGPSYGLGRYPSASEQSNYFAVNGLNLTTNSFWFSHQGRRVDLFQEEGTGVANHSMYKLTDALVLGAALEKLDSTFTTAKLNELIKAGSNDMKASYEGVLDGLRKALAGPNAQALPVGDISDSATSRVTYHATLAALQNNPIFKDLAGQLNIKLASSDVRAATRKDFGALIALQDLSPLYIGGKTPAANTQLAEIWQIARATDYAAWQADKSMSLADRQLGKETACSPIQNVKAIKKALPGVSASCVRARGGNNNTINSVAACTRKQGAVAIFKGNKWLEKYSGYLLPAKSKMRPIAADNNFPRSAT